MVTDKQSTILLTLLLLLVFGLGLAFRLTDIDDPPLDFNPTRQLRSAIIARGLFYASLTDVEPEIQSLAVSHAQAMEKLEPPIVETIVAFIYRLIGSETLWVSRIVSSIFWIIGAVALFDLGRKMGTPLTSLLGLCYFLFLPFGIRASRSFQPDPLLSMLILLTAWALFHWSQSRMWKWAFIVGFLGGVTGLVKPAGLLFVGGMLLSVGFFAVITDKHPQNGEKRDVKLNVLNHLWNPQIWLIAVLMVLPLLIYYLLGIGGETSAYLSNWTVVSRWRDLVAPSFFIRWMIQVDNYFNLVVVLAGLLGTLITSKENRALLLGFWAGYFLLGLIFPYHILTHDYYHLPLIGLISLSLIPFFVMIINTIAERGRIFQVIAVVLLLFFAFYNGWMGRSILLGNDYRDHPQFWREIGNAIPSDSKSIGITQDYGFRLMYYGWRKIENWPQGADIEDFAEIAKGVEFFVITAKNQVSDTLSTYLKTHYPVRTEGMGYIIYDLSGEK